MKTRVEQLIKIIGLLIINSVFLSGCAGINTIKTEPITSGAKLLIMPPHDVVQGGKPHSVGKGSGKQLQQAIQRELNIQSNYNVILFEENDNINHTTEIMKEEAINESLRIGADYYLILTLGEFRNAAPMTFRTDFVTLESGILVNVHTKKTIWSTNEPFMLDKTNLGNHYGLIDNIAKAVVESIVKQ